MDASRIVRAARGGRESSYFRLPEQEREARKRYAREKYREPPGAIQKRKQYMKCLQLGLIQRWKESTLARHGIVLDNGAFRFIEEKDSSAIRGLNSSAIRGLDSAVSLPDAALA